VFTCDVRDVMLGKDANSIGECCILCL